MIDSTAATSSRGLGMISDWIRTLAVVVLGISVATSASADRITIFAAASLTNAMDQIEREFEAATDHDVVVSLAGSPVLARQIIAGAPADIFISANPDWMDEIERAGLIEDGTRSDLLGNALVLIGNGTDVGPIEIGPETDLVAYLDGGRLAMALVDAVPAGIYGKAALESLGLWSGVANRVAQSDNVRTTLRLVATGEAPLGIVYASDAVAEDRVSVLGTFPSDSHPPIVYPVAALATGDSPAKADLLAYLHGRDARAAFERQGFTVRSE